MDDREIIAALERADTATFVRLLLRPTATEERLYRAYFGDARYDRLHGLALAQNLTRGSLTQSVNVVLLPGIMGSSLDVTGNDGGTQTVWLHALRIIAGAMGDLALAPDGQQDANANLSVAPSGILKRFYGETLLSLSRRAVVRVFWFDWRKSFDIAAAELDLKLRQWFPAEEKVFLVAHSMGGLVCRTFCANYREHWDSQIARLIMLGTPNFGAPAISQVLTGLEETVIWLGRADFFHNSRQMQGIINSFPGLYAMLPSPAIRPNLAPLYQAASYGELPVSQLHLDAALRHHTKLADVFDAERMAYVAGYNQATLLDIPDVAAGTWRTQPAAYSATRDGDNRVPHEFGFPKANGKPAIPVYYVEEGHGRLPVNPAVLDALEGLIHRGNTSSLLQELPANRGIAADLTGEDVIRETAPKAEEVEALIHSLRGVLSQEGERGTGGEREQSAASSDPATQRPNLQSLLSNPSSLSPDERKLEDILLGGYLGDYPAARQETETVPRPEPRSVTLEIATVQAGIEEVHRAEFGLVTTTGKDKIASPLDVVAVGHYLGVKPQTAELALDRVISDDVQGGTPLVREDFLITQLSERGIIRGDLAQPFLLPDPRPQTDPNLPPRLLAFVGMGLPGRFGVPELIVTVRELCWTLGRIGRKHLATTIIGSGNDNIALRDAIAAWLEGAKQALVAARSQSEGQNRNALARITFVERGAGRIRDLDAIIQAEINRIEKQTDADVVFTVNYTPLTDAQRLALQLRELEQEQQNLRDQAAQPEADIQLQPVRLTVSLDSRGYRFGAITGSASIPERDITVDAKLVMDANLELASETDTAEQKEKGLFLERLLIPEDFQAQLQSPSPIVLMLDSTTARIHWEMMTQAEALPDPDSEDRFQVGDFLGTSRGLTRQLRTAFAPPPEPPPPPTRTLRVLIVADPAEDLHLPGAEEEGFALEELFHRFNAQFTASTGNHIEIVRLSGPYQAKRTTVLRHLMLHTYDVLHFAGHCVYDNADPMRSGWIFTGGERLTANELRRIDRVPRFVFSNACESGVTPERTDLRSEALAPTFAESFFARGVSNFVCTAWSVDDLASRAFALALYRGLLSLPDEEEEKGRREEEENLASDSLGALNTSSASSSPLPLFSPSFMYAAMRDARRVLAALPNGSRSWGAYQHYGNPYLRLFSPRPTTLPETKPQSRTKQKK